MKKSRIVITGAGGSGKDYLKQKFIDKGFEPSISYTSRPPRNGEVSGKDYYFCSKDEFKDKILNDEFYEYKIFNGWYYGTLKNDYLTKDLFILTPPAINEMEDSIRKSSMVIYLDIDKEIRKERLSKRNDADNTERRLMTDSNMFDEFTNYDICIKSSEF